MTACARFLKNVRLTEGCWLWQGSKTQGGYGTFWANGRSGPAHRFSYEARFGPIPDGLTLDHTCRTRNCVNSLHLEPVTLLVNCQRGSNQKFAPTIRAASRHCTNGHWMGEKETYNDSQGKARCRPCTAERMRRARVSMKKLNEAINGA